MFCHCSNICNIDHPILSAKVTQQYVRMGQILGTPSPSSSVTKHKESVSKNQLFVPGMVLSSPILSKTYVSCPNKSQQFQRPKPRGLWLTLRSGSDKVNTKHRCHLKILFVAPKKQEICFPLTKFSVGRTKCMQVCHVIDSRKRNKI